MRRLKVTRSRKTKGGKEAGGLYGPSFGYQPLEEVIRRIRAGTDRYYVREGSWEADVRVVEDESGSYLVSTRDVLSRNNLANLPDI